MTDWKARLDRLADELAERGNLTSPDWQRAFRAVPRHVFVPEFFEQGQRGGWRRVLATDADGLDAVYSNTSLPTDVDERGHAVSSSSKPGLMTRMLELLDVKRGDRVLEIGTGTGYNAALLSEYLGDENVFSVDIDYVDTSRERLAGLDFSPTLRTGDGVHGLPEFAPYNRIIATVAVPRIPAAWAEQLHEDGMILADLKLTISAGNLVLLRKDGDSLIGRFDRGYATFMAMRHPGEPTPQASSPADGTEVRHGTTTHPPLAWEQSVPWFLSALKLPSDTTYGLQLDSDYKPAKATITSADGSWAHVDIAAGEDGHRAVAQAGPRDLWDAVEFGYAQWDEAGQPSWDRLGLTVSPDGRHTVWLDEPSAGRTWTLPR
ncbi:protein-L-isoaspartate carboxylmethyltransferase [Amycolatopsis sp. NPDC047767]|uniref:protein-L-isoaspartate carboxylmethyltransferase n=1 Tax=Amycolatopsis sp. NPDC047767 TaxID=3156765 RepID=UPI0034567F62